MEQFKAKFKRPVNDISAEGECALLAHDWPGNVRELRNAIQRAMILEEPQKASEAGDRAGERSNGGWFQSSSRSSLG